MSRYFEPASVLIDGLIGKKLEDDVSITDVRKLWEYYKRIATDKHLYAVVDVITYVFAACVDNFSDFETAYNSSREERGASIAYYALSNEEHDKAH